MWEEEQVHDRAENHGALVQLVRQHQRDAEDDVLQVRPIWAEVLEAACHVPLQEMEQEKEPEGLEPLRTRSGSSGARQNSTSAKAAEKLAKPGQVEIGRIALPRRLCKGLSNLHRHPIHLVGAHLQVDSEESPPID